MKKLLTIAYMAILTITCKECNTVEFEHDYEETFTTTLTGAVGPTTQTGVRVALPEPTPTDVNAIWLAPNGNDANPGTEADPVLTLAQAITLLTASKKTVHIFRNSYVGDLVFALTAVATLPVDRYMQVEDGEIGEINAGFEYIKLQGLNKLNGIYIYRINIFTGEKYDDFGELRIDGSGCVLDNINVFSVSTANITGAITIETNNSIIAHCSLDRSSTTTSLVFDINNSILLADTNHNVFNNISNIGVNFGSLTGKTVTINANRSVFHASYILSVNHDISPMSSTVNFNCENCVMTGTKRLLKLTGSLTSSDTLNMNYDLDYCLRELSYDFDSDVANEAINFNENITETNKISQGTAKLYIDEQSFVKASNHNLDPNNVRLQAKGKATSTGAKYHIDSPLIGAGLAGVDINPWDESTVFTSRSFLQTSTLTWPPSLYNVKNRFVNSQSANDVHGNLHSSFDALRRTFEFGFGDGSNYANNNDLRKLIALIGDNTSMRFYPRAIDETLFINPVTGIADGTSGTFSDTDNSYAPTIISGNPMIRRNWAGFWIKIDDGGDKHFYIDSNDASKLYLIDKLSEGFPTNGTYDFSIEYIVVRAALDDIIATQDHFSKFLYGGSIRETADNTTLAHELRGYSIALLEGEDLWE